MQVLQHGDCLIELKKIMANSIDSVITDPPAGISFMGKAWDDDKGGRKQWIEWMSTVMAECLRVLKPGGHALIWAIPRTSHWTATAIEDAGFEVRDVVTHLFGSGFPKSLDISKAIDKEAGAKREITGFDRSGSTSRAFQSEEKTTAGRYAKTDQAKTWQGFGTALKPAAEFWILARKPLSEKTVAKNVLKHGTGGLNIDASRIGIDGGKPNVLATLNYQDETTKNGTAKFRTKNVIHDDTVKGRFPANLVLSGDAPEGLGEYARFFYCAKVSASERNAGLEDLPLVRSGTERMNNSDGRKVELGEADRLTLTKNSHPTVKPQKLMQYLIKLITPPGGTVLDPFMGSGSTGLAAKTLGFRFIGIEKEKEYYEIAEARIESVMI